jgi:hypothetical protein
VIDCMLRWLEHFKPLWDFLTAIGTVGLAAVTVWLANRKPKLHLTVSAELANEGQTLLIRILNDGAAAPLPLRCDWVAKEFGRIDIPMFGGSLNGRPMVMGIQRMTNGDTLDVSWAVDDLAQRAANALSADLGEASVKFAIQNSSLSCTTTTGESFRSPLSSAVQETLAARVNLHRRKI